MDPSRSLATSYSVPYQDAPKEPTLVVPAMPDIGPPQDPVPPRRPPPPGYDMKTLRRQVEYLQEEINSRVENYHTVCGQNEKLFTYVQEMVRANDYNVNNMRDYCRSIHEELRLIKRERSQLIEKLEFMVNSKRLLADLGNELKEAQVSAEEMAHRRQDAELALRQAMEERRHTEEELHEKVEKMKDYEALLDRYREQSHELQSLDLAEEFFFKNRKVLKSAYMRFRQGIRARMRLTHIRELCERVYRRELMGETFFRWSSFLQRRRFMQRNRSRRQRESLQLLLARWKIYYIHERLFARLRRRRLQRLGFDLLVANLLAEKRSRRILQTLDERKQFRFVQSIFHRWKDSTMFLDWFGPLTRARERMARDHFLKTVFCAWKEAHHRESSQLQRVSVWIRTCHMEKHFQQWRFLCLRQWKYRGRLLRRFLAVSRRRLSVKAYYDGLGRKATNFHWQFGKRRLFARWRHFVYRRQTFSVRDSGDANVPPPPQLHSAFERKATAAATTSATTSTSTSTPAATPSRFALPHQLSSQSARARPAATSLESTPRGQALPFPATPLHPWTMSVPAAGDTSESQESDVPLVFEPKTPVDRHQKHRQHHHQHQQHHHQHQLHHHHHQQQQQQQQQQHVTEAAAPWCRQRRHRQALSLLSHYHRRLVRRHLWLWQARSLATREMSLQRALAVRHHHAQQLRRVWRRWFLDQHGVRRLQRLKIRVCRMHCYLRRWHHHVCTVKRHRQLHEHAHVLRLRRALRLYRDVWKVWLHSQQRHQRLRRTASFVHTEQLCVRLRRAWQHWYGHFLSKMLWRQKEVTIDVTRLQALHALHQQTLQDKRTECGQWRVACQHMEDKMAALRVEIAAQEARVRSQTQFVEEQTAHRDSLEQEVLALQARVAAMQSEKRRWGELEASMQTERAYQQQLREERQQDMALQVAFLQEEQRRLQSLHAQQLEQAKYVSDTIQHEISQASVAEQEAEQEALLLEQELHEETRRLADAQQVQRDMLHALQQVQSKVRHVVSEAEQLHEDNMQMVRQQRAENEVLKTDAGVAQARLLALLEMVEEASLSQGKMRVQEMESSEQRERAELDRIRNLFQEKFLGMEQRYVPTTPGSSSGSFSKAKSPAKISSHKKPTGSIQGLDTSRLHTSAEDALQLLYQRKDRLSFSQLTPSPTVHVTSNAPIAPIAAGLEDKSPDDKAEEADRVSTSSLHYFHRSLNEETKRLDRHYEDARTAMRALTSRLTRPLPMDSL